jgi:riboflavin synthase
MFTGIITQRGIFRGYRNGRRTLTVEAPGVAGRLSEGESLAVNGVCLTVTGKEGPRLHFDLAQETLGRTNLGTLRAGAELNLELPATLETLLSGHIVTGHVDGPGRVVKLASRPPGKRLTVAFAAGLRPYLVPKGSVAVDGVSLTIAALGARTLEVELIPATLKNSTLGALRPGQAVNLECDIIGKYVYNYLSKTR